jgi:hypothetical protein
MLIGYLGVHSVSTSPSPILLASTLTSNFISPPLGVLEQELLLLTSSILMV